MEEFYKADNRPCKLLRLAHSLQSSKRWAKSSCQSPRWRVSSWPMNLRTKKSYTWRINLGSICSCSLSWFLGIANKLLTIQYLHHSKPQLSCLGRSCLQHQFIWKCSSKFYTQRRKVRQTNRSPIAMWLRIWRCHSDTQSLKGRRCFGRERSLPRVCSNRSKASEWRQCSCSRMLGWVVCLGISLCLSPCSFRARNHHSICY